jgi:phosphohistidine phosphatase
MKKEIILVRHGKAADHSTYKRDIDRVLTERGVSDGYKVAEKLINEGIKPDLIITSPAARASHTALIFLRAMKCETENLVIDNSLYHCSADTFFDVIAAQSEDVRSIMLVAHNPGVTDVAYELTRGATSFLPTTGVAVMKFDSIKWQEIHSSKADKYLIIKPKEL